MNIDSRNMKKFIAAMLFLVFVVAMIILIPRRIEDGKVLTAGLRQKFPEYKTARVMNLDMAYRVYGRGYPVIMIHGYMNSSQVWGKNIEPLTRRGYRVYVPDLFGHGLSDKPADATYSITFFSKQILEFMNSLDIKQCIIIGHSMGGATAIKTACIEPRRVSKLILLGSAGGYVVGESGFIYRLARVPLLGEFLFQLANRDIVMKISRYVSLRDDTVISEKYMDYYFLPFTTKGYVDMALKIGRGADSYEWDLRECAKEINVPVLILHGTSDRVIKYKSAKTLNGLFQNSTLITLEGAPHNVMESDWQDVNREIIKFLNIK